ncbi:MAG: nucleotide sugar dehydrogenase [Tepidibacter sp.]|uniref:nucleotide sugar dehydrogenase n=1 Tax=Tepidibacter sp. TaxID=2529387 RepID=UPI0025DFCDC9|nr:nucleotide sugar dehydrogenase [Tepidibacter sp.]MCT4508407.1 nucleotide sugar dehydrogenase [Tepidibacter sp.]
MNEVLKDRFIKKNAQIAIIGLGYVGLPLAIELANVGFKVFGIDTCENKINNIENGKSYIESIKDESIKAVINKNLFIGNDYSVISKADSIIICVPTPLNKAKEPDMSYIIDATEEISRYLKEKTLVVLESTTYPGTTEELIIDTIEKKRNYKVGKDFFACYSPERIDPGNTKFNIQNTPKIIAGSTPICLELGVALYDSFVERIVSVSSLKVAEVIKLFENSFRSVNIALVNELTQILERMNIDVWEVIEAASTKPFGFMSFYPGPGIGGHCIPLDPMYLSWRAKKENYYSRFIELSSDLNVNMTRYIVKQISNILNKKEKALKNSKILIIGIAYKKDIDDLRESPAIKIYELLEEQESKVKYYDPYIDCFEYKDKVVYSQKIEKKILQESDLVVIITDHTHIDYQYIIDNSRIVYDTRNITKKYEGNNIILLGENIK